jgi:hypothetical protein
MLFGCDQRRATSHEVGASSDSAAKLEQTMTEREKLIAKIHLQIPPDELREIVVSLEDFFTGNNDRGSIGCNLGAEQPSIAEFYRRLREIRLKPDVQDVLVRIYEYDDPTSWPHTDTVYIISSAPLAKIKTWVSPLLPDEVYAEWMYGKPPAAPDVDPGMTAYSVWWD